MGHCADCGKQGDITICEHHWQALIEYLDPWVLLFTLAFGWMAGMIGYRYSRETVSFTTFHGFCGACKVKHILVRILGALGAMLSGVAFVAGLIMAVLFLVPAVEGHTHDGSLGYVIGGVVVIVLAVFGFAFSPHQRKPWCLRRVAPGPFVLKSVRRLKLL